jgi:dipeptidyl aminopeptidase/acylaminoacyl peptidase
LRSAHCFLFFVAACAPAGQQFTPGDWWDFCDIAAPRINAEGTSVVYVESWNLRDGDRACSNLWTVSTAGGAPRRLTDGPWRDTSPAWSPDGASLAYLSDRDGTPQIWVRRLDSGADRRITSLDAPPLTVAWSPNGASLAFTARATGPRPSAAWAPAAILPMLRRPAARVQLFVIPAAGGTPRALPLGEPDGPLDIRGEPAWMPDGQAILVSAGPPPDAAHALEGGELYAVRTAGGALRRITRHAGPDEAPVPSPDGSRIAWLAREPKAQSYVITKLYVANADGSRAKVLAGVLDRDVSLVQWSNESRTVYFLADDRGATHVYAARNDGSVRQVTKAAERLRGFSLADNGRAVTIRQTPSASAELVTFPVDLPAQPVKLAAANSALLASRDAGAVEEIQYASGGKTIQGWIVKPPAFDAARKYPLLLEVDDSPRRMCGGEFRLRAQIFAARGFVVLCANPRGTPGYGEESGNLIRSRFPGDDFDDLMRGVDHLIAKGYVDPARLSISGGLLAAWAIGHTDRFRAAVVRHAVADWVTDVAHAPDGIQRAAAWMGAMPWEDPEQYVQHSPVYFAGNFRTPTLVLAGGTDPGAEELYFALQARKVDSAFVQLGEEGRPSRVILEWEAMLGWLEK